LCFCPFYSKKFPLYCYTFSFFSFISFLLLTKLDQLVQQLNFVLRPVDKKKGKQREKNKTQNDKKKSLFFFFPLVQQSLSVAFSCSPIPFLQISSFLFILMMQNQFDYFFNHPIPLIKAERNGTNCFYK